MAILIILGVAFGMVIILEALVAAENIWHRTANRSTDLPGKRRRRRQISL